MVRTDVTRAAQSAVVEGGASQVVDAPATPTSAVADEVRRLVESSTNNLCTNPNCGCYGLTKCGSNGMINKRGPCYCGECCRIEGVHGNDRWGRSW